MKTRRLILLGSTGSIGRSTLDVVTDHPGRFEIVALTAHSSVDSLVEQYHRFRPKYLGLTDQTKRAQLSDALKGEPVELLFGEDEIVELAALDAVDMVVNAIVGAAGLRASLATIRAGKNLALANKESLVVGGPLFAPLMEKHGGRILPIDSEHSALWQALQAGKEHEVRRLIITASGGPFRELPIDQFDSITRQRALDHPTWKMGPKITIDSATMANKGLEVIEAAVLFTMSTDRISVVVHPQSIVHSMVEFVDSSIIAQLSQPDMRMPICYALFWPERAESSFGRLDPAAMTSLTFEPPDFERFPALKLAYRVADAGGIMPAAFNAANEVAVEAFLKEEIKFTAIPQIIADTLDGTENVAAPSLQDILEADRKAREFAHKKAGTEICC